MVGHCERARTKQRPKHFTSNATPCDENPLISNSSRIYTLCTNSQYHSRIYNTFSTYWFLFALSASGLDVKLWQRQRASNLLRENWAPRIGHFSITWVESRFMFICFVMASRSCCAFVGFVPSSTYAFWTEIIFHLSFEAFFEEVF